MKLKTLIIGFLILFAYVSNTYAQGCCITLFDPVSGSVTYTSTSTNPIHYTVSTEYIYRPMPFYAPPPPPIWRHHYRHFPPPPPPHHHRHHRHGR